MKYEWEAGGYEKVSATPHAPGLSGSALAMPTQWKWSESALQRVHGGLRRWRLGRPLFAV